MSANKLVVPTTSLLMVKNGEPRMVWRRATARRWRCHLGRRGPTRRLHLALLGGGNGDSKNKWQKHVQPITMQQTHFIIHHDLLSIFSGNVKWVNVINDIY